MTRTERYAKLTAKRDRFIRLRADRKRQHKSTELADYLLRQVTTKMLKLENTAERKKAA